MPKLDGPIGSQILDEGKTPAQWVKILAERGVDISERTLRERANETGAFYRLGRTMLITPAQLDIIFEGGQSCRSKSTRGGATITPTPLIRVRAYDNFERIAQDTRRGKESRIERTPSDKVWIEAFCKAADPYNAALVRFMFETAARIGQAVSLVSDDLLPSENKVRVKATKGHEAKWIVVSPEMMSELRALPLKRPKNRKTGKFMGPRVFGYGSSTGYNNRWKTICKRAGIPYSMLTLTIPSNFGTPHFVRSNRNSECVMLLVIGLANYFGEFTGC